MSVQCNAPYYPGQFESPVCIHAPAKPKALDCPNPADPNALLAVPPIVAGWPNNPPVAAVGGAPNSELVVCPNTPPPDGNTGAAKPPPAACPNGPPSDIPPREGVEVAGIASVAACPNIPPVVTVAGAVWPNMPPSVGAAEAAGEGAACPNMPPGAAAAGATAVAGVAKEEAVAWVAGGARDAKKPPVGAALLPACRCGPVRLEGRKGKGQYKSVCWQQRH